jgi:hypothetical protein
MPRWIDRPPAVLGGSIALYLASCLLPALMLHTGGYTYARDMKATWHWTGHESLRGAQLLFTGWFGMLLGNFSVLANPALWLAWILYGSRQYRAANWLAGLAIMTFQLLRQPYYFDEAGARRGYLKYPEIGFLCWLAGMALILFSGVRARNRGKNSRA